MMYKIAIGWAICCMLLFNACSSDPTPDAVPGTQFTLLSPNKSGVQFENKLKFVQDFNIYKYRNFYNGGGVGVADVNNDGFVDIYFTANMEKNRLYLNNGDMTFTDVTDKAGVGGSRSWSTGVSMVDINADGNIDIYVCNSGNIKGDNKQNELFINQGDGTFLDRAEEYGLADQGYSTHAAFFDYDKDGDLDAYLLNNSFQAIGSFNLKRNERPKRNKEGGDKLYRNDNGQFVDVSEEAGIYGSVIGFGLGVTIGDINLDGWMDIFVSNDFFERDYIYMNNGDGTFTEDLENQMKSITGASMGADMADINNDGYPEIFVTEMLPEPHERLKTKTTFENWDRYQYNVDNGYYHQFTRNMLHLNNGNNSFSEVGRMVGVEATDWSWGALITDFDNDGYKDLFIANGIYKDLTDQDYINYISTREMAESVISDDGVDFQKLTDVIPSNKIPNYMYRNTGQLVFDDVTEEWGLAAPSHSNGSVYADLDNDGDHDLIINNVNATASIYQNHNDVIRPESGYVKLQLVGIGGNTQAIGSRIIAFVGEQQLFYEQMPVRGFESSVDPRINIGIGQNEEVDSLIVIWPDGTSSKFENVQANQLITIEEGSAPKEDRDLASLTDDESVLFTEITDATGANFIHTENDFVDFDRDRLMYHMLSVEGPALCSGDLNGDGRTDLYIGGAKDQSGAIFLQRRNNTFQKGSSSVFEADSVSEDVDCSCFDADNDGDLDIYVASGGNEFPNSSSALIDRLYLNNGRGRFVKSNQVLPSFKFENSSSVSPGDFDNDGDLDLFIGVRAKPFLIGVPADGYILQNDGKGKFIDVTNTVGPGLKEVGMITDAVWVDSDQDNDLDLMVVGEWMELTFFENENGKLTNKTRSVGLDSTNGWWNRIATYDLDGDGDMDFVVGNHGLNSRFQASRDKPVRLYVNDFDQNGSAEGIVSTYFGDTPYPLVLKHDLVMQMPSLKKKYVEYVSYKDQTVQDIFTEEQLAKAIRKEAYLLESVILINDGVEGFKIETLPTEAQLSPMYGIAAQDFDGDGHVDLTLGGNFYNAKPEVGRYDASYGVFLKGDGQGKFTYLPNVLSGLNLEDQVRSIEVFDGQREPLMIVARNNTNLQIYTY